MTFYLIGLGLDEKSLSETAVKILEKCKKVYLETYTIEFPYSISNFDKFNILPLTREHVEGEEFVNDAKKMDIALLVYGSPLVATTHISLILKCKKDRIKCKILHNASILDAIAETGLQLYKFGKTTSIPAWSHNYTPKSFVYSIKENKKIDAHTLLLVDIGTPIPLALEQLEKACQSNKIKLDKIVLCSRLGTEKSKIAYNTIKNLKKLKLLPPASFIIPGKLHFIEEEALNLLKE